MWNGVKDQMRRCWGRNANLRRCARTGDWRFFCVDHKHQWVLFLVFLIFTLGGGTASLYGLLDDPPELNLDPLVYKAFERLKQDLREKEQTLTAARQREGDAFEREQSLRAALKDAISAIPRQTEIPNAQARIKEALEAVAKGNTALAEAIFSEVEARNTACPWRIRSQAAMGS